jgi:hypothetical protein
MLELARDERGNREFAYLFDQEVKEAEAIYRAIRSARAAHKHLLDAAQASEHRAANGSASTAAAAASERSLVNCVRQV